MRIGSGGSPLTSSFFCPNVELMVVRDIKNIIQKRMLISYRREYHADAFVSLHNKEARPYKIEFSVEMTPLGSSIIRVKLLDELDYPLVPLLNELKQRINELESKDTLPRS